MASPRCPSRLFPLAASAPAVMGARFADRIGKGIRGSPRDAMVADETPPEIRGRAFGLRQSLDTVGALLAPIAAIGLMALVRRAISARSSGSRSSRPRCRFLLAWLALREPEQHRAAAKQSPLFAGFRELNKRHPAPARGRLPVQPRPLLRSLPDPQGIDIGLQRSPVAADAGGVQPRLCRARLPGRRAQRPRCSPRTILMARHGGADRRQSRPRPAPTASPASASARPCGARTWR